MAKTIFVLSFAALAFVAAPNMAFAGCDHDVADKDLVVADPMSEREILALIAETKQRHETSVEQASK